MSLGKMTTAVMAASQETTMALANLNFDFSLIKIEAPKEYQPVGEALSSCRVVEAEKGDSHITARKLGALFKGVAPDTQSLFRAYGLRASEILQNPIHNPRGTKSHGMFADQIGADGTSIWAAATSGHDAIAVHLLACMLARLWSGSEATSLWVEFVNERQKILSASESNDSYNLNLASRISLTRNQLATWDASARAWLHTADQAKEKSQKQVLLIINNLGFKINNNTTVYESVVQVWTTAMTMMNQLIQGIPQSVNEGGVILGLSAWHLFPDMMVLVKESKLVRQQDSLISPGGVVTLGIKTSQRTHRGIFWSLPLSYHRYYGDSRMVYGSYSTHTARVSLDDLLLVALGSLLGSWFPDYHHFPIGAEIITSIYSLIEPVFGHDAKHCWPALLSTAAQRYLASINETNNDRIRLVKAGRRRYGNFLTSPQSFGLANPYDFLATMKNEEAAVDFLRHVARNLDISAVLIVQYLHATSGSHEIATITNSRVPKYARILGSPSRRRSFKSSRMDDLAKTGEQVHVLPEGRVMPWFNRSYCWDRASELCLKQIRRVIGLDPGQGDTSWLSLKLLLGNPHVAALYVVYPANVPHMHKDNREVLAADMIRYALKKKSISPLRLVDQMNVCVGRDSALGHPLQAFATLCHIVDSTKATTVSLKLASRPIKTYGWALSRSTTQALLPNKYPSLSPFSLSLQETFACIVMIESGSFDLDPKILGPVMAMSYGNSLYVADQLLNDPIYYTGSCSVTRVIGNLGRPGISLLVPPEQPRVAKVAEGDWQCINHNIFDGRREDCFQYTTLHLGFSDWKLPVDLGEHGLRNAEIFFVEAFVTLYDRGKWIADLDILGSLKKPKIQLPRSEIHIPLDKKNSSHEYHKNSDVSPLVSIERWEELLEPPIEPGVVKAYGNWQARLAATVLSVQNGHQVFVLDKTSCWQCLIQLHELGNDEKRADVEVLDDLSDSSSQRLVTDGGYSSGEIEDSDMSRNKGNSNQSRCTLTRIYIA